MKIFNRFTEINELMKNASQKDLDAYKYILLFLVLIDLVGIYWFLQWKSWGIAIFFILMALLTYILLNERRLLENKMVFDEEYEEDEEEDDEEDEDLEEERPLKKKKLKKQEITTSNEMNFSLPDPEEYNKNMEKAFGRIDL